MQFPRTINSVKEMQETNRTTVLRELFSYAPMTRGEIVEKTGLSSATITRIIKDLIREKLVIEVGKVELMQGRNRELLQIDYEHINIIGFEVNESFVQCILCDLKGEMKMSFAEQVTSQKPEDIALVIRNIMDQIAELEFRNVIGVGLSISGIVSVVDHIVVQSNTMGWRDIHVNDLFPPLGDRMIKVENDANAALLGEIWLGDVPPDQNVVYIVIGEGAIGASLFVDGQLARGSSMVAGEISHFPVEPDGKECVCGHFGCLEAYVSLKRLQKDFTQVSAQSTRLIEAFKNEDPQAKGFVVEAAEKLAIVIRSIAYLMNPSKVILGGLWIEAGDEFLTLIRAQVKKHFSLGEHHIPQIVYSKLHPHAGVMGAVGLVIDEFFKYQ